LLIAKVESELYTDYSDRLIEMIFGNRIVEMKLVEHPS
jgi:hypothetical protein